MTRVRAGRGKNSNSVMENSREIFYRIIVDGVGIYEAVDRDCPKDDPRRENKPDGSWLPKKGLDHPGAISFWTAYGLKRYRESGLMDWHASVISGRVEIVSIDRPKEIISEDKYQIIARPDAVQVVGRQLLA